MPEAVDIGAPWIQFGFAGFSIVLVGIIVWLIKRLLAILQQTNDIIAANTNAICEVGKMTKVQSELVRTVHDQLLSRPCLLQVEDGRRLAIHVSKKE